MLSGVNAFFLHSCLPPPPAALTFASQSRSGFEADSRNKDLPSSISPTSNVGLCLMPNPKPCPAPAPAAPCPARPPVGAPGAGVAPPGKCGKCGAAVEVAAPGGKSVTVDGEVRAERRLKVSVQPTDPDEGSGFRGACSKPSCPPQRVRDGSGSSRAGGRGTTVAPLPPEPHPHPPPLPASAESRPLGREAASKLPPAP